MTTATETPVAVCKCGAAHTSSGYYWETPEQVRERVQRMAAECCAGKEERDARNPDNR